jgi:hypothetical protein
MLILLSNLISFSPFLSLKLEIGILEYGVLNNAISYCPWNLLPHVYPNVHYMVNVYPISVTANPAILDHTVKIKLLH